MNQNRRMYKSIVLAAVFLLAVVMCSGKVYASETDTSAEALSYENITYVVDGNSITVTGANGHIKHLVIPAEIDGLPVKAIRDHAFQGINSLKSAELPEGLEVIGRYAFSDCKNLLSARIPDSVISIGDRAFSGCYYLSALILPEGPVQLGGDILEATAVSDNKLNFDHGLFYVGDTLLIARGRNNVKGQDMEEDVVIRDGTRRIADGVFELSDETGRDMNYITSITFPASVTEISDTAIASPLYSRFGEDGWSLKDEYGYSIEERIPLSDGIKAGLVIKGYEGTAAERWAKDHGFPFEALGADISVQTEAVRIPSARNTAAFIALMLGEQDVVGSVLILVLLIMALIGVLMGPTKVTTVKTYRGGKLVSTNRYTETSGESFARSVGNMLGTPAPKAVCDVTILVFGLHIITGLLLFISMLAGKSAMLPYENGAAYLLSGIGIMLLNTALSFMVMKISKKSLPLTIAALAGRLAIAVIQFIHMVLSDYSFIIPRSLKSYITGTLSADLMAPRQLVFNVLNLVCVIIWAAVFAVTLIALIVWRKKSK